MFRPQSQAVVAPAAVGHRSKPRGRETRHRWDGLDHADQVLAGWPPRCGQRIESNGRSAGRAHSGADSESARPRQSRVAAAGIVSPNGRFVVSYQAFTMQGDHSMFVWNLVENK
ncbi:MAG TPA: hypothetical protein VM260_11600, partial [Pirellula sp.]|nr:hypothetical protein [Pirellula sp.]